MYISLFKSFILVPLVLLLVVGLLLRLEILRDPFHVFDTPGPLKDDYYRDYLIAHHIVAYNEYPRTGHTSPLARYINSPAYFYLLAVPLFVKDSFVTLGIFNIALQLLTLVLVFALARSLFGNGTAFIAAILFGFHQRVLGQSNFIWQPNAMQPFFILSCLLLALAYQRKSFAYLLSSIPVFFFSLALHNSVLALVPLYLFFLLLVLKKFGGTIRHYAITGVACLSSYGLFYAPLFFYTRGMRWLAELLRHLDYNLITNFYSRITAFFNFFLFGNIHVFPVPAFVLVFVVLVFYYFFCSERDIQKKKFTTAILSSVIWFLFAVSFVPPGIGPIHYFTSLLGLSIIFVAEIIDSLRQQVLKVVFVVSILYLISPMLLSLTQTVTREFIADGSRFFNISYQPPPFIAAIKEEILKIKKLEGRDDYNFFDFRLYVEDSNNKYVPAGYGLDMFWSSMEMELLAKLTKVDDSAIRSYRPLTDEQYIFLACDGDTDTSPCLSAFLKDFPRYELQKTFWANPYQMYLTKR